VDGVGRQLSYGELTGTRCSPRVHIEADLKEMKVSNIQPFVDQVSALGKKLVVD
jgi:hypothetical protein